MHVEPQREIIFMDGEFAELKPDGIDLLSIALIKENGEELYLELDYTGNISPWVKENVLPLLTQQKVSKEEAVRRIKAFVGDKKPSLMAFVDMFDWMGICKLFDANDSPSIINDLPFHWVPIDFSSLLTTKGFPTGTPLEDVAKQLNIPVQGHKHNALDDTRLLRTLYLRLFSPQPI